MFIFILPVLVASTVAALFTVTTGMNFVIFAVTTMEWQRRRGYKGGEGRLTRRENGTYYSTGLDQNSDHDLSYGLGLLAHQLPTVFEPFIGKRYDFTESEGQMLRAILEPAIVAFNELDGMKAMLEEDPNNEEVQQALFAMTDNLGMLVRPIIVYLEQFPTKRVKKAS